MVRFKMSNAEYARLNDPNYAGPKPQICIELSHKHPEPHNTLPPINCFELQFDCLPECPTVGECERKDCAFPYIQGETILLVTEDEYVPDFLIFNHTGKDVISVTYTLPLLTLAEIAELEAAYSASDEFEGGANDPTTFNITTSNTATNTLLIFTQVGDKWEGLDPITTLIENVAFTFTLPQAKVDAVSGSIGLNTC